MQGMRTYMKCVRCGEIQTCTKDGWRNGATPPVDWSSLMIVKQVDANSSFKGFMGEACEPCTTFLCGQLVALCPHLVDPEVP